MNKDLFTGEIAELLEQNENLLPGFANKEMVWKSIESKLRKKSRKIKLFRYAAIVSAACIISAVCFTFFFQTEQINENEVTTAQINSQQTDLTEVNQTIRESKQSETDSDFTVYEENIVKKNTNKNFVAIKPVKAENPVIIASAGADLQSVPAVPVVPSAGADLQSVPSVPVVPSNLSYKEQDIDEFISKPNDLPPAIPKSNITVRVSLSPGKPQNEKNEKLKIRISPVFFADNENKASGKNVEENRTSTGLLRIPL